MCGPGHSPGGTPDHRKGLHSFYHTVLYMLILDGPVPDSNAAIVLTLLKYPAVLSWWSESLQCEALDG